jgi:hypothetical protein
MEDRSFMKWGLFLMILAGIFLVGFEAIKLEAASTSGTVEAVGKDHKSVTVNGQKMVITPRTTIVDHNGNNLKANELTPSLSVQVEGGRSVNGFEAIKIYVNPTKKKP